MYVLSVLKDFILTQTEDANKLILTAKITIEFLELVLAALLDSNFSLLVNVNLGK